MSSLTPQKLAAPSPQQPFLATPSPPRIRHAPGLSRYERDTAAAAAQEEAKRRQVTRRPPQDASARQNANQQAREGPNEQEARKASSRDDGIPGNKDGSVENKAVAARENPPVTHTWGDGMDVKQVGEWRLGRVIGKGTSGEANRAIVLVKDITLKRSLGVVVVHVQAKSRSLAPPARVYTPPARSSPATPSCCPPRPLRIRATRSKRLNERERRWSARWRL